MPFGFAYGSSSRRSRLRRRSSIGSMPIRRAAMSSSTSRASDSNCHGPAVRGAPDGVRVDRSWPRSRRAARGTGPGNSTPTAAAGADRPRRRIGAAVGDEVDVRGLDRAVGVERHRHVAVLVARLARRRAGSRAGPRPTSPARRPSAPASIRHISSRWTMTFWPKPPPVSRITTRMRCSGMPEQAGAEQPHLVRRLRRRVDRELAGGAASSRRRGRAPPSAPARTPAGRSSRATTCAARGEHVVERRRRAGRRARR